MALRTMAPNHAYNKCHGSVLNLRVGVWDLIWNIKETGDINCNECTKQLGKVVQWGLSVLWFGLKISDWQFRFWLHSFPMPLINVL